MQNIQPSSLYISGYLYYTPDRAPSQVDPDPAFLGYNGAHELAKTDSLCCHPEPFHARPFGPLPKYG
jgi:hypothetical protein